FVLRHAPAPWSRRSGVLPGRGALPHLLVSGRVSRTDHRSLHGLDPDRELRRFAGLGAAPRARWRAGAERLAVVVPDGGGADDAAWIGLSASPDRSPGQLEVAHCAAAPMADRTHRESRGRAARGRASVDLAIGAQ